MLSRVALRATVLRHGPSFTPVSSLQLRTYAAAGGKKPPKAAVSPVKAARPKASPPPPKPYTGPKRQTSPGTALPKDQTWKPEDGIKLSGAPAAAAATATSKVKGAAQAATSPVEGARPDDRKTRRDSPIQDNAAAPQEPIAQKLDMDEPVPGSIRQTAQDKIAESENTPQQSEHAAQDKILETEGTPEQPARPLPDLRQGIPSTFDFEFGGAKQSASQGSAAEGKLSQEDKLDLASAPAEGGRRGGREERDYDQSAYETSVDRRRRTMARWLYVAVTLGAVGTGVYFSRPFGGFDDIPKGLEAPDTTSWSPNSMYRRVRARMGHQMGYYTEPSFPKLLPDVPESQRPPMTLVLSLEDLMIHTTWDTKNGYRTAKRPGIDYFIRYLSQYYELVLFTSAPRAMADPIVAKLDPFHFIMWPLGREATKYENGEYVKDLSYLNRPLNKTLIIDTHAPHVKNQPENAIIIPKWSGDPKDPHVKDLVALIPFLEYVATVGVDDVRPVLESFSGTSIPEEFARRESEARAKFQAQLAQERGRRGKFSLGSIAGSLGVKGGAMGGGGMVLGDGQSVAEGLAQGKMLSDQIREQGQKQYEHLEKQIREHGEQWLKEEQEEMKKLQEAQMKDMKKGALSWFGGGGEK
ncbi:unnamed protein product [Zymoseptoria tritici ST99CH_1E4]|uniref:Mitochondrial import inner membrane translocase subunit TIM50 n=1 Tax=Zymoseptoria tritici ST99CH_1E4 TaxID=1276532 RepID=A0A2H1FJ96_ZYMTR|nr:unnamed protein product [Zymoseptoria tritici ST99CH_1E4]